MRARWFAHAVDRHQRFDYAPNRRELTVTFTTARVYVYEDVPAELAERFRAAFAKGRFFNAHVRDRFACREVGREL
jgi:lysyl-tRNA synthetase class 2